MYYSGRFGLDVKIGIGKPYCSLSPHIYFFKIILNYLFILFKVNYLLFMKVIKTTISKKKQRLINNQATVEAKNQSSN